MDFQSVVTRLVHNAEISFDWLKYRIGSRLNGRDSYMIIPYVGIGSREFINIKGRVLEDNGVSPVKDTDRVWQNMLNMYRRFESDEIPNALVLARFQGIEKEIVADEEGFFEVTIELNEPLSTDLGWQVHKIDGGYEVIREIQKGLKVFSFKWRVDDSGEITPINKGAKDIMKKPDPVSEKPTN